MNSNFLRDPNRPETTREAPWARLRHALTPEIGALAACWILGISVLAASAVGANLEPPVPASSPPPKEEPESESERSDESERKDDAGEGARSREPRTSSQLVDFRERASPRSFRAGERRVGVFWSLDYRYPDIGFQDAAAPYGDPLRYHFREPSLVNPLDVAWLTGRVDSIASTGVDWVAIRTTFDAAEDRTSPLPHLVRALDRERSNRTFVTPRVAPRIVFDLTTESAGALRLSSPWGKQALFESIASFYREIPPRHRAMIEDRPIVVLSEPPPVAAYGEDLFEVVRRRFRFEFGVEPFVMAERRWGLEADATFVAGGALAGPEFDGDVVLLGPGFDDSRDPTGVHPVRDREDGAFYRNAWSAVRAAARELVLIDSWNDLRRGTAICETREFGTRYMAITREEIERFRSGALPDERIDLRYAHPRPRPDWSWGRDARGAANVVFDPIGPRVDGLSIVQPPDGAVRTVDAKGRTCLMTIGASPHVSRYAYFAVSDYFWFDTVGDAEVEIQYFDGGSGSIELQFDASDERAMHDGAYRGTKQAWRSGEDRWKTLVVRLSSARFANRQNGGADFRIAARGSDAVLGRVTLRKAGG